LRLPPQTPARQANLPVFGASGAVSFEAFSVTSSLSGLKREILSRSKECDNISLEKILFLQVFKSQK